MQAITNAKQYDFGTWMLGIMRAFISGGSSAIVSGAAVMGIAPEHFNLGAGLGHTLKLMGAMFLFNGIFRLAEFLSLHGAPDQLQASLASAATATKEAGAAIADAQSQAPKP